MDGSSQTSFNTVPTEHEPEIINAVWEIASYELLWNKQASVNRMAKLFLSYSHALPSTIATKEGFSNSDIAEMTKTLRGMLPFSAYSALFYKDFEYPSKLRDAKYPIEILYYRGALDLLSSPSVSIVGARKASDQGKKRAAQLARLLVKNNFTIMSGLAEGIDTAAHTAAIEAKGQTIAVIGTALNESYPKSNRNLQEHIAQNYLLVSQVPFYFSKRVPLNLKRMFFPERNKTMSALSSATIIVEASDTSGSLTQARAAIEQKRKLFILNSCFEKNLKWPETFLSRGAIKVVTGEEILSELKQ